MDGKQHKAVRELNTITLANHALRSYMTWLPVTLSVSLTWLLYNLQLDDVTGIDFENSPDAFGQSEKRCEFNV